MNKKMVWALVIGLATTGVGVTTTYAAATSTTTGNEQVVTKAAVKDKGSHFHMKDQTELLSLLKLDEQALKDKKAAGQSLAEIAEAQGVTRQQLSDALVKQQETQLAQAVADGKLTQEQADSKKASFADKVAQMIDAKGDAPFMKGHDGFGKGMGMKKGGHLGKADQTELLNLLKLDQQALHEKRAAGQTLAEIAEAQGVTRQQLIDVLVKQHEAQLAKAVEEGKLTQEQADTQKATISDKVTKMIDEQGHGHGDFKKGKRPAAEATE